MKTSGIAGRDAVRYAELPLALADQLRWQSRAIDRRRWGILIPGAVMLLAAAGLWAALGAPNVTPRPHLWVLGGGVMLFGITTASLALEPWLRRPRVVPCFSRPVGEPHGPAGSAFARGHAIFREMARLDGLARVAGVTPLSSFGFADDAWGQVVRWHPVPDGLDTVRRLRAAWTGSADAEADLAALEDALVAAEGRAPAFTLVLRLHGGDAQSAALFERRQGRFW